MLFVGDDWVEGHHDIEIMDATGRTLAAVRLPEGVEGITRLHELTADHSDGVAPHDVLIAIETDRGPWVTALIAAGYRVYAVNPRQTGRFRERFVLSGDPRESRLLGYAQHLVGTERWETLAPHFAKENERGNSHMPRLALYQRMLAAYRSVVRRKQKAEFGLDAYRFSIGDLQEVLEGATIRVQAATNGD
ncbi:YfbU-like protein [Lentzea atacamensis]|uniref:YfbU-like protein n=1 Tax=Lentzea atacamensis TaxID=531938 RepID=A0ABX9E5Z6_9PSEU|nr:YfbU-like protein [Lentzea atacamensis]